MTLIQGFRKKKITDFISNGGWDNSSLNLWYDWHFETIWCFFTRHRSYILTNSDVTLYNSEHVYRRSRLGSLVSFFHHIVLQWQASPCYYQIWWLSIHLTKCNKLGITDFFDKFIIQIQCWRKLVFYLL